MGGLTTSHITASMAREALQKHGTMKDAAQALGVHYEAFRRRLDALQIDAKERETYRQIYHLQQRKGLVERQTTDEGEEVRVIGPRTREELVNQAEIDLDFWEEKSFTANMWGQGVDQDGKPIVLAQSKAVFVPRGAGDPEALQRRFDERLERMAKRSPKVRKIRPAKDAGELIVEPSIYDFHLGMAADAKESGETVTLESAKAMWRSAVDLIVSKMPPAREIDRIVFPFGNDMAHINDRWGSTGNGTPQDRAGALHQIAEAMESLLIETLDIFKEIAPVEAICVPGNHGPDVELFVARYLDAWFRNDENVTIDAGRNPFKFRRWGNTCIGFTHGKGRGRRIPTKDLCGQFRGLSRGLADGATWLEWHVGHEHHKEVEEHFGVRYRMIPSLVASDSWHHHSGYHGAQRAAEIFAWDRRYGEAGKVPVSLLEIRDAAGLSEAA